MDLYLYKGPVMEFGKLIDRDWFGRTYAPSDKKAMSNLKYQFKMQTGRMPGSKISLPGALVKDIGGTYGSSKY